MYKYVRTIFTRAVIIGLTLFIPLQGVGASAFPHKSALAPPIATKPPCQIIYNEKSGKCDVVTNDDVISSWDRETVKSFREGVTASGQAFRNRWAFVDVSYLIGQMLILTQEHKLQNPKDILIPLVKKHIRNRNGEAEILLEGYNVDGIEEVREGREIKGFSIPVTRNGAPLYRLVYSLQGGDTYIPMKDGTKVYVMVEDFITISVNRLVEHPERKHDILNDLTTTQKEEVRRRAVEILQSQIEQEPGGQFAAHIKNYVIYLKILAILDILDGICIYPFIGIDVFPAQFCKTVGINTRDYVKFMLHDIDEKNPQIYQNAGVKTSLIRSSLIYEIGNALNVNEVTDHVDRAKSSDSEHTALILKGLSWAHRYDGNPEWAFSAKETYKKYLVPLCNKLLKSGDHIVAFDEDLQYCKYLIESGEYEEVKLNIDNDILKHLSSQSDNNRINQPFGYGDTTSPDRIVAGCNFIVLKKKPAVLLQSETTDLLFNLGQSKQEPTSSATTASPESERIHATNFQDTLTYIQAKENARARQAAEEPRPTIVALGTSWIKGYEKGRYLQHDALNPLVSSIRQFCKDQGIAFIDARDEDLMTAITQVPGYTRNAKVIVLAGEETIKDEKFNDLVNEAENLFLAGVDSTKLTGDSYIRLMEMLTITMKLAHGLDVDLSKSNIPIEIRDGRYIFVPNAEPMDYEKYQFIYKLQTFA